MRVLRDVITSTGQSEVTVGLAFQGEALPTIADLRLRLTGPARLVQVGVAPALSASQAALRANPDSGEPFRKLSDGTIQLLVTPAETSGPIAPGTWLFMKVLFDTGASAPLTLAFVPRVETFAPAAADEALWGQNFGTPLVVWPDSGASP